jgi:hypothetical protein
MPAWNNPAPTGQIFIKFDIRVFFHKYVKKNLTRIMGRPTSHKDTSKFIVTEFFLE